MYSYTNTVYHQLVALDGPQCAGEVLSLFLFGVSHVAINYSCFSSATKE